MDGFVSFLCVTISGNSNLGFILLSFKHLQIVAKSFIGLLVVVNGQLARWKIISSFYFKRPTIINMSMVVMNHKTKQCNRLENNDELGFLNDLVKTHLCEIWFVKFVHHHLQMFLLYIIYHLDCLWKFWTSSICTNLWYKKRSIF